MATHRNNITNGNTVNSGNTTVRPSASVTTMLFDSDSDDDTQQSVVPELLADFCRNTNFPQGYCTTDPAAAMSRAPPGQMEHIRRAFGRHLNPTVPYETARVEAREEVHYYLQSGRIQVDVQSLIGESPICGCPVWVHRRVLFVEHMHTCAYNAFLIRENNTLSNESGWNDEHYDVLENQKYARKLAYDQKAEKRKEHKLEGEKLLTKRQQKLLNKLRKRGIILKLKNESRFTDLVSDLESRLEILKQPLNSEAEKPFLDFMQNMYESKSNVTDQAISMALSTGTYFAGLYMAKDYAMMSILTLQWLQALVPNIHLHLYEGVLNLASTMQPDEIERDNAVLMNESLTLSLDNMRDSFRSAYNLSQNLQAVPFYKGLSKAIALGVLLGWIPQTIDNRSGIINQGYELWVSGIENREKSSSIFDLCMECIMFSLEFLSSVQNGTVNQHFKVPDLLNRGVSILAREHLYRDGTLESVNMTPEEFVNEVRICDELIGNYVKANVRVSPAIVNAFARTQFALKKLLADIDVNGVYNKLKVPAHIVLFTGPSQIGKSSLTMQCATNVGAWEGFPTTDEYIWNKNTSDKYDSGYMSNKTVIIIDDVACEKPDKVDPSEHAKMFINYSNAMPYVSVQADVDKKGKIPLNHKLVVMTSNNPHLNMQHYMNNPEATYERILMNEVRLNYAKYGYSDGKGGYLNQKVDPLKVMAATVDGIPPQDQFFFFPFRWVKNTPTSRKTPDFVKEYLPECPVNGMQAREFWLYLKSALAAKKQSGEAYRKTMENYSKIPICSCCGLMKDRNRTYCQCLDILGNEALFDDNPINLAFMQDPWLVNIFNVLSGFVPNLHTFINSVIIPFAVKNLLFSIINVTIDGSGRMMFKFLIRLLKIFTKSFVGTLWITTFISLCVGVLFLPEGGGLRLTRWCFLFFFIMNFCFWHYFSGQFSKCIVRSILSGDRATAIVYGAAQLGLAAMGVIATLKVLRNVLTRLPNEGALCPTSINDMVERKKENNMWKNMPIHDYKPMTKTATMTSMQFETKVASNVVSACFIPKGVLDPEVDKRRVQQNLLFINNNTFLMMSHVRSLINEHAPVRVCRNEHEKGGQWSANMSQLVTISPDITMGIFSRAYAFTNLEDFFIEDYLKQPMVCAMLSRTHPKEDNFQIRTRTLRYEPQMVRNESATAPGSTHVCSTPTQPGDCGSPVVTRTNPFSIVGLHACGDGKISGCFAISRKDIVKGLTEIRKRRQDSDIYLGPAPIIYEGPLTNQYGTSNINIVPSTHERDVTNFIAMEREDVELAVLGSDTHMRRQYFSDVKISPLSPFLEDEGIKNLWGKPKFDANRNHAAAFQTYLDHIIDLPELVYSHAIDDYVAPILDFIDKHDIKFLPLSMKETVNGDGSRFKSRMDMSTSSGLGLISPKSEHFEIVNTIPRLEYEPKQYLVDEFFRVEDLLKQNKLPGHVFVSSLKDEPTPISKDKVRVFQVGPVVLTMVCRKYLLPILDFMYGIPLLCEMAQGINCADDEWHQLAKWLREKSTEQCIEGDFSSYDIRQSGQSIRACGFVFRMIAKWVGYSVIQQNVVENLINEVAFKTFCFNGSVFLLDGYMPSGVPVTIAINGITNALLHRIAYYGICADSNKISKPFREVVNFITMGDDSIGSTIDPDFNMVNIQEQMARINMPYTDGHKNANTRPFFPFEDIQFCKRKFLYNDIVGKWVAPIQVQSIHKSWHCYMLSKTPVMEIVLQNLNGGMRELARHPKSVFDEHRLKIIRATEKMEINHLCSHFLLREYEDWWDILKEDFKISLVSSLTSSEITPGSVDSMESLDHGLVEESLQGTDYS